MDLCFLPVDVVPPDFNFCIRLCVVHFGYGQKSSGICFSSGTLGIGVYFYLDEWQFGAFDFWGRNLPNIFSDVVGHPDLRGYLLHRLTCAGLGVAGILFWIANMKRLRDCKEHQGLQWGSGGVVVLCSVICLFLFWDAIRQRENRSEEYRQAYVEYQSRLKARVANHEITYEWKDGEMWLDSKMILQNRNQKCFRRSCCT